MSVDLQHLRSHKMYSCKISTTFINIPLTCNQPANVLHYRTLKCIAKMQIDRGKMSKIIQGSSWQAPIPLLFHQLLAVTVPLLHCESCIQVALVALLVCSQCVCKTISASASFCRVNLIESRFVFIPSLHQGHWTRSCDSDITL